MYWDKKCLPKARFFSWLTLQNKILIADTFREKGYVSPRKFPFCEEDEENVDHLLLAYK